ncbi:hypothetical protein QBC39DRAFT_137705 [Podospora conica]|nr:hypothetical protein QBC39DRAFT_137705 [Schizothecium conicum]
MDTPFNLRRRRRNHLDATAGREVVFCHQCRNEWYNDEHPGLICPECGSGASEIVTDDHDPRETFEFPALNIFGSRSPPPRPTADGDSDPDEMDIDSFSRDTPGYPGPRRPRRQPRVNSEDIMSRFTDMLMNDLGGARPPNRTHSPLFPPGAQRTHSPLFPTGAPREDPQADAQASVHAPPDNMNPFWGFPPPGAPGTVQRTTIRSGPSGSTTFTIVSSSSGPGGSGANFASPFPALFGQLMGASFGEHANRAGGAGPAAGAGPRPMGPGLEGGLQALLASLLNPQNAVHGDAVYSQEALDRIITSLMEANPQSNAAPPATDDAIGRLEKKKVDEQMLGAEGKAECTICMDDLSKGDEVTVLPCSHWFHGECVTLWLKQHNTCPICRAAIEQRNGQAGGAQQQPQHQSQSQPQNQPQQEPPRWDQPQDSARVLFGPGMTFAHSTARTRPAATSRSARENEERLNAIRNAGNSDAFQSNNPFNPFLSRRDSRSPTRRSYIRGYTSQRVRSPSTQGPDQEGMDWSFHQGGEASTGTSGNSNTRDGRDRDHDSQNGQGSSGGGPFSWFRNHFGHGSGGSSDRERDRGR